MLEKYKFKNSKLFYQKNNFFKTKIIKIIFEILIIRCQIFITSVTFHSVQGNLYFDG